MGCTRMVAKFKNQCLLSLVIPINEIYFIPLTEKISFGVLGRDANIFLQNKTSKAISSDGSRTLILHLHGVRYVLL